MAPVPLSVYTPTPEQARAAALYVCTALPKDDAAEVLFMLGLVEGLAALRRGGRRDLIGRAVSRGAS